MVDHSARVYMQLQNRHKRARLSIGQASKIEATAARSFSDDADICRNALSAPRSHSRPGQRDDAVNCSFNGLTAIM